MATLSTDFQSLNPSALRARVPARAQLYVLIACEESQVECSAFRELGHIAFSCDIQKCARGANPAWHIHADVTPFLHGETQFTTQDGVSHSVPAWDLIIAHPPCTYLCRVSSVHMIKYGLVQLPRYEKMKEARAFFFECLNAAAAYVAVENPIPMAMADLPRPSCYVQPYWYGHPYSKKTLYWLKNLPPLLPAASNPRFKQFVRASRGKYRSRTFPGVAQAIAQQWSAYILDEISRG